MNHFIALLCFISLNVSAAKNNNKASVTEAYITVLDPQHLTSVRVNIENSEEAERKIKRSEINFGDGFISTKKDVIHQYAQDGVYNITIKTWDNKNVLAQYSKSVDVASNLIFSDGASILGPKVIHDNRKISFSFAGVSADKKYKLILTKQELSWYFKYYAKYLEWYNRQFESKEKHKDKFEVNVELNDIAVFSENEITENTLVAEKFVILKPENKIKYSVEHARRNKYILEIKEVDFVKDTQPPVISATLQSGAITNNGSELSIAISDISGAAATNVWRVMPDGSQQLITSTSDLNFNIPLTEGVNNFIVQSEDKFKNRSEFFYLNDIVLDTVAPTLISILPNDATIYTYQLPFDRPFSVRFSERAASVNIGNVAAAIDANATEASAIVTINQSGENSVPVAVSDLAGNTAVFNPKYNVVHVTTDPVLNITEPGPLTKESVINLPFTVVSQVPTRTVILVNGVEVFVSNSFSASPDISLPIEGINRIEFKVYYAVEGFDTGLKTGAVINIERDTVAPLIISALPESGTVIYTNHLPLTIPVDILFSEFLSAISINNLMQPLFSNSYTTNYYASQAGPQQMLIRATDRAGNTASLDHSVSIDFSDTLPILDFDKSVKELLTNKISVPISGTSDKFLTSAVLNGVPISVSSDGKTFYGNFEAPKNGRYKLEVIGTDRYGNIGSTSTYIRVLQELPDNLLQPLAPALAYDGLTNSYYPDFGPNFKEPLSGDACAVLENIFETELEFKDKLKELEDNLETISNATGVTVRVPRENDLANFMGDVEETLNYLKAPYLAICKGIFTVPQTDCPANRNLFRLMMGSYPEPLIIHNLPIPISVQNFLIRRTNICTGFDSSGLSCNDMVEFLPLIVDLVLPGVGQVMSSPAAQAITETLVCSELCNNPEFKNTLVCTQPKLPEIPQFPTPTNISVPKSIGDGGSPGNWGGGGWPDSGGGSSCGSWFEPSCPGGGGGSGGSGSFFCSAYPTLWYCGNNGENSRDHITIDDAIDCAGLANGTVNDLINVGVSRGLPITEAYSAYVAKCLKSPVPGYPKTSRPVITVTAPVQNQQVTETVLVTGYVDDIYAQVKVNGQLVATTTTVLGAAFSVTIPVPANAIVLVEAADLFGNLADPVEVVLSGVSVGVTDMDVGYSHVCAIKNGGLKCLGVNYNGNLGNGSEVNNWGFQQVIGLTSGVTSVSAGPRHSCAIVNGGVKCWGSNNYGQLGINSVDNLSHSIPVNVIDSGATNISVGGPGNTCAVINGGVKCWGYGLLRGNGTYILSSVPAPVTGLESGVKQVTIGSGHACALLENNTVKCWGQNNYFQLGVYTSKVSTALPVLVPLNNVKYVNAGANVTCFGLMDGSVKCAGFFQFGQLGNGSTVTRGSLLEQVIAPGISFNQIDIGESTTCATDIASMPYCWGLNDQGALGYDVPVSLVPTPVIGLNGNVTSIKSGSNLTCALVGPDIKCWGSIYFKTSTPTTIPF